MVICLIFPIFLEDKKNKGGGYMADADRYEIVGAEVDTLVSAVMEEHFDILTGVKIKTIYDTKKRTHGGRIVFGRMQKCNDLIKFLTDDVQVSPQGYDFFLYLDKNLYQTIDEVDKRALIFHELNHCGVDFDRTDPYYIVPHDVETFYAEIEYHKDDSRWHERLSAVADSVYAPTD